jgi:hypothetical protein
MRFFIMDYQEVQLVAPVVSSNVPAGQLVHVEAPVRE